MPTVNLTADEALVLFEMTSRITDSGVFAIEHPGELAAIWRLAGILEKVLVEPFDPRYDTMLQVARGRLAEQVGLGPHSPKANE